MVTLDLGSSRIRQARLSSRSTGMIPIMRVLMVGLMLGGGIFIFFRSHYGYSLLGLGLLLAQFAVWHSWQLSRILPASKLAPDSTRLEDILEQKLLASINHWPLDAAALWEIAAKQWQAIFILNRLLIHPEAITPTLGRQDTNAIWEAAIVMAAQLGATELDGGIVAAVYLAQMPGSKQILGSMKLDEAAVMESLLWQRRVAQAIEASRVKPSTGGIARDWASGYTPTLSQIGSNVTYEVEGSSMHHIPQMHQASLDQALYYLARDRGSLVLLGDIGAGKTTLVYSLAERLITAQNASGLEYYQIIRLNAAVLQSMGGNPQAHILQLLGEASHAGNIILFFDDASLFFGSNLELPEILLPLLQQSVLKLIFAATPNEWSKISIDFPALGGLVRTVKLVNPSETDIRSILQDAAIGMEHKSGSMVTYAAIKESYRLAERYLSEQAFPGKGIDVLQNAMQYPEEHNIITARSVQQAIESRMGVKVGAATQLEQKQLLNLEDTIHERMINQSHAVQSVANALRRSRAGVGNPNRPVGSFLFLGPTGVGKTELAKAVAATYFGSQDEMIRLDMSEYQQSTDVARILAASSAAKSGESLISSLRKRPFTVVLLDEIEKAHPDILNLLLQMLDEGNLTDSDGRKVSFKDAIIVATSNAGADDIRTAIGAGQELEAIKPQIVDSLIAGHQFKPELINRFDEIVLFRPLNKTELLQVAKLMIAEVNKNLALQKITVELSEDALVWLADNGYDPKLGARPMRRLVQQTVENAVARRILGGELQPGTVLSLTAVELSGAGAASSSQVS